MRALFILLTTLFILSCKSKVRNNTTDNPITDTGKDCSNCYKVTVLPTDDASPGDSTDASAFKYPYKVPIDSVFDLSDKIAAYGAAYRVWVAPKGWTGKGCLYTNGGVQVNLFPPGGSNLLTEHIYFSVESSLSGVFDFAAPYFPDAMNKYNALYNEDHKNPIKIPNGIKITHISPTLITYTLPPKNGLQTKGIVFYGSDNGDDDDRYCVEAKIVLAADKPKMMNFLMNWYMNEIK